MKYKLPYSPYLVSEWVSETEKKHHTVYTAEHMLHVRRETIEKCLSICKAVYFDEYPDAEDYERSPEHEAIRELLKEAL